MVGSSAPVGATRTWATYATWILLSFRGASLDVLRISYLSTPGAHQHRAKVQERTSGLRVDAARGFSVFGLVDMI